MKKTPEKKLRMNRERYHRPEVRAHILAYEKARRADPEKHAKIIAYQRAYYAKPENRAHKTARAKEKWQSDNGARKAKNRAWYERNKNEVSARRRERWANDLEYRERMKSSQARWKQQNLEKHKAGQHRMSLKRKYGITPEEHNLLLERADKKCAICGRNGKLHLDHCHRSNQLRGILCSRCNQGLGFFLDNAQLLKMAILYLESAEPSSTDILSRSSAVGADF